jgi:hypothetical protein
MGPTGCSEMSVTIYQSLLRTSQKSEDLKPQENEMDKTCGTHSVASVCYGGSRMSMLSVGTMHQ